MGQIIVKNMTLGDYISNVFYKKRYQTYRRFRKRKLKNYSPRDKRGLELTFEDEFTEVSWGTREENKKWLTGESWGKFHPDKTIHYYGNPELVPNSSCAKFTVTYEPKTFPDDHRTGNPITIPFKNSLLSTHFSHRQQHGQFECRCTIPHDKAVWPAWWMYGNGWPPEIDIFEMYGRKDGSDAGIQEINLHYGKTEQGNKDDMNGWGVRIDTKKNKDEFHEFTLKWTPEKIECFTDGIKIFQYTRKEILDKWYNDDADMKLVVNHGLDEKYIRRDEEDFHSEFLVDYVRAYK